MIKKRFAIFAMLLVVLLTGCVSVTGGTSANRGGVFVSENRGESWQQKTLIPTVSGKGSNFGDLDINVLAADPSDPKALYAGSADNGLFYTYNGANTWNYAGALDKIVVNDLAIDAKNKCTIYVASANKLFKSTDCSRSWNVVYFDNNPQEKITAVAVDHYNSEIIFIGLAKGRVLKSLDQGANWRPVNTFTGGIERILISPKDSRLLLVSTDKGGLFRSFDSGGAWQGLNDGLAKTAGKGSLDIRDIEFSPAANGLLYLAAASAIYRSEDNGNTWKALELLTNEKDASIYALALDPKDTAKLYYSTRTTFYRSSDSGASWSTQKLPTSRAGWRLLINEENPDIIYMAARSAK